MTVTMVLQGCVEVMYILIQGTIYCAIVYWMCWFQRDAGHSSPLAKFVQLDLCYFLLRADTLAERCISGQSLHFEGTRASSQRCSAAAGKFFWFMLFNLLTLTYFTFFGMASTCHHCQLGLKCHWGLAVHNLPSMPFSMQFAIMREAKLDMLCINALHVELRFGPLISQLCISRSTTSSKQCMQALCTHVIARCGRW